MHARIPAISFGLALGAAALFAACGGGSSYGSSGGTTPVATKPAAANAVSPPTVKLAQSGSLGQILTDANGRTLYVFLSDKVGSGKSVCNGACAQAWPPLTAASGQPVKPDGLPGELSVVTRDDGTVMVAYNGQPLYYYAKDAGPGDVNGQAVGNVWYVVPPGTTAVTTPAPAQNTVKVAQAGALGQVLVGPDGRTLYMYTKDVVGSGKSACTGACAQAWPPLAPASTNLVKPEGLPGELSVITRDDGTMMVAYNGQPLYYYAKDDAPGDVNGQAVGNVWYVVPAAASASSGVTPGDASASASPGVASDTAASTAAGGSAAGAAAAAPAPSEAAAAPTPAPTVADPAPTPTARPAATVAAVPTPTVKPAPYSSPGDYSY